MSCVEFRRKEFSSWVEAKRLLLDVDFETKFWNPLSDSANNLLIHFVLDDHKDLEKYDQILFYKEKYNFTKGDMSME